MTKVLVDSNILIYAHQKKEHDKHSKCANRVNELIASDDMVLSIQNLVEFSRVLTEKASIDNELVRQYVFDLSETVRIISYNENTVMDALLFSKQHKIHFFDALLAATMQENGISKILTENLKDFKKIKWLMAESPFE
ncbi:PIN domain-containing protein [Candidatus Micrarchaeota archaeon]|nr:PIN domain-containing protein [Candidatus Micrarchaeota archaeon]MBU1166656.1 PIN domain-containing protein [Candidatus Micrarchaeota archaeon]MBU1886613.1 PIN domain-containing protein [Candidatus Micrarchaeota archaeon]